MCWTFAHTGNTHHVNKAEVFEEQWQLYSVGNMCRGEKLLGGGKKQGSEEMGLEVAEEK